VWRSVFYSAIAGWALLLALLFAATHVNAINTAGGGAIPVVNTGLSAWAAKFVLIIFTVGQLFCGAAGLTSASRTWYAFSRDRGMPGWWLFRRLTAKRVPFNAVIAVSVFALIITIPAYFGNKAGVAWAYAAITAICTVGLYLAYIIPVYLRLRAGSKFQPGPWTLGNKYKWVNVGAIAFVVLVLYALDGPFTSKGAPWNSNFDITAFNYTPAVLVLGLIVGIWWWVDAKNRYHGPVRTIDETEFDTTGPPPVAPGPAIAGGSE
jgi:amino acid transporter